MPASAAAQQIHKKTQTSLPQSDVDYDTFKARIKDTEKGDLVAGEMKLKTPASAEHEEQFGQLHFFIRGYVAAKNLGKVYGSRLLVRINTKNGYEPDILFVAKDRLDIVKTHEVLGPPDVVVEIISKNSRIDDRVKKFMGYEQLGVKEYWIIDPDYRIAEFYELIDDHYRQIEVVEGIFRSTAIPGFWFKIEWLFASSKPNEYQLLQAILAEGNS